MEEVNLRSKKFFKLNQIKKIFMNNSKISRRLLSTFLYKDRYSETGSNNSKTEYKVCRE